MMSARTKVLAQCFSNIYNWINGQPPPNGKGQIKFKPVVVREVFEISEILPNSLYLSGSAPLTQEQLNKYGITAIVNTLTDAEERAVVAPSYWHSTAQKIFVRVLDSETSDISIFFESTSKFIDDEISSGGKVLVHCMAGISRSPTLIMAYLIRCKNYTLMDAYDYVASKRHIIQPNDGFFCQLASYEKSLNKNKIETAKLLSINEEKEEVEKENDIQMTTIREESVEC